MATNPASRNPKSPATGSMDTPPPVFKNAAQGQGTQPKSSEKMALSRRYRQRFSRFADAFLQPFKSVHEGQRKIKAALLNTGLTVSWKKKSKLFAWLGYFTLGVLGLFSTITAIYLGGSQKDFALKQFTVAGYAIDQDLELILIGLINKIADIVIQILLEQLAIIILTVALLRSSQPDSGASLLDFSMFQELTKPWISVGNWITRSKKHGWLKNGGTQRFIRFLVCSTISISVLLFGPALNTMAYPKQRWYPNDPKTWGVTTQFRKQATIRTPLKTITGVDWSGYQQTATDVLGFNTTGPVADIIAISLASMDTFAISKNIWTAFHQKPNWWQVGFYIGSGITWINTAIQNPTVETVSTYEGSIREIYDDMSARPSFARAASGWYGFTNVTLPHLRTTCRSYPLDQHGLEENSLNVSIPNQQTWFLVSVGPSSIVGFEGTECNVTFSQVLFGVSSWIYGTGSPSSINLNSEVTPELYTQISLNKTRHDEAIAKALATNFQNQIPQMLSLFPQLGLVPTLVSSARGLKAQDDNLKSDAQVMAVTIGSMAQQQLTTATWTLESDESNTIPSYPIRWQIYGASPRLRWEWVMVVPVAVILIAILCFIILTTTLPMVGMPWFSSKYALIVGNSAPMMQSVQAITESMDWEEELEQKEAVSNIHVRPKKTIQTGVVVDAHPKKPSRIGKIFAWLPWNKKTPTASMSMTTEAVWPELFEERI